MALHNGGNHNGEQVGQIAGTARGDDAHPGNVGELISATVASGSAVSLTTDTPANVTSISLTPGDWDISAMAQFAGGATTTVGYLCASIHTTSATLSTADDRRAFVPGDNHTQFSGLTRVTVSCGPTRISVSSTTTVYFVGQGGFGLSTLSVYGTIQARRVR